MTKKEIKEEIDNLKWLMKNTSPTWDEFEFYENKIDELEKKYNEL